MDCGKFVIGLDIKVIQSRQNHEPQDLHWKLLDAQLDKEQIEIIAS